MIADGERVSWIRGLNKYASNTTMALLHQVIDKSGEDRFIERQASSGLESSVVRRVQVQKVHSLNFRKENWNV